MGGNKDTLVGAQGPNHQMLHHTNQMLVGLDIIEDCLSTDDCSLPPHDKTMKA
jgi:hypothetical protein